MLCLPDLSCQAKLRSAECLLGLGRTGGNAVIAAGGGASKLALAETAMRYGCGQYKEGRLLTDKQIDDLWGDLYGMLCGCAPIRDALFKLSDTESVALDNLAHRIIAARLVAINYGL